MLFPSKWAWPSNGKDLIIVPTVLGERCRLRSHEIFAFPRISKTSCFLETEAVLNSYFKMIRLYNVLRKFSYLSKVKDPEVIEAPQPEEELDAEVEENAGLNKALDTYRKLIDRKDLVEPLTEKEQDNLEKKIKEIENREVVEKIEEHDAVEIPCEKNKITIGPPTLTDLKKQESWEQEHYNYH